jgi:hypothetical protein
MGSGHESPYGPVAHEATGSGMSAQHEAPRGPHTPDPVPEECPCLGGVCDLSVQADPAERSAPTNPDGNVLTRGPSRLRQAVLPGRAERYLQPPGTGPPTVV